MIISMISAVAENRVIGNKNALPWHMPADFKHFKETTLNKTIVMGLNTFKSIFSRIGKPLPGRKNIVLVFEKDPTLIGCEQATSLKEAFEIADTDKQEVFIIGGASIYKQSIDSADRLYITRVHASPEGDTSFPEIKESDWKMISSEDHTKDDKNEYDYSFTIYERRK